MADVWIGLGSNVGGKEQNLQEALTRLSAFADVIQVSSFHDTAPVGYLDQDRFLNAAAHLRTTLGPAEFMQRALAIELEMGRVRTVKNGPRTIDIDVLLWDDAVIDEPELTVPHPRMHEREFVLAPLREIAPGLVHPVLGKKIADLGF